MHHDDHSQSSAAPLAVILILLLICGLGTGWYFARSRILEAEMRARDEATFAQHAAESAMLEAERQRALAESRAMAIAVDVSPPGDEVTATTSSPTAPPAESTVEWTVEIDREGGLRIDGQGLDLGELGDRLRSAKGVSLTLRVDPECRFAWVAQVLAACKEAGAAVHLTMLEAAPTAETP